MSTRPSSRLAVLVVIVLAVLSSALVALAPVQATAVARPTPTPTATSTDGKAGDGSTGPATIERSLAEDLEEGRDDFFVRFDARADLAEASQIADWADRGTAVADALRREATRSQADTLSLLRERNVSYRSFWATNAILVRHGSAGLARTLAAQPEVEGLYAPRAYSAPDPTVTVRPTRTADDAAVEWGIHDIHADQVWQEYGDRGEGIVVANIDSGVQYDHPALVEQYRGNNGDGTFDHDYNWMDVTGSCAAPCDDDGHGTHTMGTMVGNDADGTGIGVAPGARWIAVNGCCPSDAALIAAGEWILEPTDRAGENPDAAMRPDVVNNSWGSQAPSNDPFMEDIEAAWAASGIFSSFANGNSGPGCATSGAPGSRSVNYSVGAYDASHRIGSFSSRGPGQDGEVKPSIAAPGVSIRSSVPGDGYEIYNGTSMAAPHLAGAVALLWSAAPVLVGDVDGTRRLLDESAVDTEDLTCGGTAEDNNVWGQGRLDVAALLAAAPKGDAGFLTGTVTAASSGEPLADATVSVDGPYATSRTTGADGTFTMPLPVGSYEVTVSGFGYRTEVTSAVEIAQGATTTQDVALEDAEHETVSGTVVDGSGHGWPLYAEVSVAGTGVHTFTDPETGEYSLDLPVGTYDVTARPVGTGYRPTTATVDLGSSAAVADLVADVDPARCSNALGYHLVQPRIAMVTTLPELFQPWFDQRQIDVDMVAPGRLASLDGYDVVIWGYSYSDPGKAAFTDFLARTDAQGTGVVFLDDQAATWGGVSTLAKYTGVPTSVGAAVVGASETAYYESIADHPVLDGVDVGTRWDHEPGLPGWLKWFTGYEGDGRQVLATVGSTDAADRGAGIAVQQRANNRHVLLAMHSQHYTRGPGDWSATSERVFENALSWANPDDDDVACLPSAGGLVVGHVSDLNTGDGVVGARVRSEGVTVLSEATSQDPALDDGLFRFFSGAGEHEVTAGLAQYQSATTTVNVEDDQLSAVDLSMAAGRIELSQSEIAATVPIDGSAQRTITIANTGSAPTTIDVAERDGGSDLAVPEGYDGRALVMQDLGAPQHRRADVTPLQDVVAPDAGQSKPRARGVAADASESWQGADALPRGVLDNVAGAWDNRLYSFGGTQGAGPITDAWVHAPDTGWQAIAAVPQGRQRAAGAFVAGRFVMLGGWGPDGSPAPATYLYDPDSDTWSRGADHPEPLAAAGSAVVDGRVLTIGGCGATCGSRSVVAYDVAADSFERLADYPEPAGWLNCGTIRGKVYCAGGYAGDSPDRSAYVYDPQQDAWSAIAPMPVATWGSAAAVQGGRLLVSGGISAGVITNAGWAYTPGDDTWVALPNAPQPSYRAGSVCGFYTLGGSPNGTAVSADVSQLTGQGECASGAASDVPWLAAAPTTLSLEPGETAELTLTLDGTAVAQPGGLRATVRLVEDSPYAVPGIAVSMTVPPPSDWGAVLGTVRGQDCAATTAPLAGATVQVDATGVRWTGLTGTDGTYVRWVDRGANPVRVSALADGWSAATSRVKVKRTPTVVDLTLRRTGC